jgi:glutathione peroxidase
LKHTYIITLCIFAALFVFTSTPARAEAPSTPAAQNSVPAATAAKTAFDFSFFGIDGTEMPLSAYRGKVLLVVNTATGCGFAGHFRDLQQLQETYGDDGLVIIGVPSNDFGGQEPLDGDALQKAVKETYGVTFPLTQKTAVSGNAAHPFYAWAAAQNAGGLLSSKPRWNFHKYLIGRDGRVVESAGPTTGPRSTGFEAQIKAAIAAQTTE